LLRKFSTMRFLLASVLFMFISGCFLSADYTIQNRWDFEYSNAPLFDGVKQNMDIKMTGMDPYKKVFLNSKFIIRSNHTFDIVLFDNYVHGNWEYDKENGKLVCTPVNRKQPIVFRVDSVRSDLLQLRWDSTALLAFGNFHNSRFLDDEGWFTRSRQTVFRLSPDELSYSKESKDPYSGENNQWRIKPAAPESPAQIKERIKNHVHFFILLYDDAQRNETNYVSYEWFVSPLLPASNGIALRHYSRIKDQWENYFYDSTQAMQGYQLLEKAFDKKIDFPIKIDSKFQRNIVMLEQVLKNME